MEEATFASTKEEYEATISPIKKVNRDKAIEQAAKAYNILYFEPSEE